jgi:hypothetical protein
LGPRQRRLTPQAWKKKWFVLRSTSLAYYKDNKVRDTQARQSKLTTQEYSLSRAIELNTVHSVVPVTQEKAKHPFSFAVVTADRTFFLEASSAEEREDWVGTINHVRKQMAEREEEKNRRSKSVAVPVPGRPQQPELELDTHQGTWASTFSANTSASMSPTAGTYFHRNALAITEGAPSQRHAAQRCVHQPPPVEPDHTPSTKPPVDTDAREDTAERAPCCRRARRARCAGSTAVDAPVRQLGRGRSLLLRSHAMVGSAASAHARVGPEQDHHRDLSDEEEQKDGARSLAQAVVLLDQRRDDLFQESHGESRVLR